MDRRLWMLVRLRRIQVCATVRLAEALAAFGQQPFCLSFVDSDSTYWLNPDFDNLLGVLFVIKTQSKDITKVLERTFDGIGHGLLLDLIERDPLASRIGSFAKADIFVKRAIAEGDAYDATNACAHFATLRILVELAGERVHRGGGKPT